MKAAGWVRTWVSAVVSMWSVPLHLPRLVLLPLASLFYFHRSPEALMKFLFLLAAALAVASASNATEPVCTPTTCRPTEDCVLKQVQCIRAPCSPVPACVAKATQPSNVCTPGLCPDSEECVPKQVQCLTAPCPPIPTCVPQQPKPRTCLAKCHAFQRCYLYNNVPHCADVCAPGRCKKGEVCELQRVQCLVAPCPRVAFCKPM